jgi:hypothetical protein
MLFLCARWTHEITDRPIRSDAVDTVQMAVNLTHHGVISSNDVDFASPTMYREPFPALSAAAGVIVTDAILGEAEPDAYLSGARARYLKYQNVIWKAITSLAAYAILVFLTSPRPIALGAAAVIGLTQPGIDTLMSEPIAGALLTAGAAVLMIGFAKRKLWTITFAGLCFGLLALTKAVFLYVFIGLVPAVALCQIYFKPREAPRDIIGGMAVLVFAFVAVVIPWMYRNYVQLDHFQISERAGFVLYSRAVLNQMTWDEYQGSFYTWSDRRVKGVVGAMTGFGPADLERGGRLQRLNEARDSSFAASDLAAELAGRPEAAITYYSQARAERVKLLAKYEVAGHPRPMAAADEELKRHALALFSRYPSKHLAMTVLLLWRGATLMFPVFVLALIVAISDASRNLLLIVVPTLGFVLVYALFTYFEARYGTPARPLSVVAGTVLLTAAARAVRSRFEGGRFWRTEQLHKGN